MRHLLSLPREIRDVIYTSALETLNIMPPFPKNVYRGYRGFPLQDRIVTSSMLSLKNHCAGLLRVNKQTKREVTQIQDCLRSRPVVYKAACKMMDDMLFPIWLSVPVLTTRIAKLVFDIRPFGRFYRRQRTAGWWGPEWLCHFSTWGNFYRLFSGLVYRGQPLPAVWQGWKTFELFEFWRTEGIQFPEAPKIHVDTLVLSFVTPHGMTKERMDAQQRFSGPTKLVHYLATKLMWYHLEPLATAVCKAVSIIRLEFDGEYAV